MQIFFLEPQQYGFWDVVLPFFDADVTEASVSFLIDETVTTQDEPDEGHGVGM